MTKKHKQIDTRQMEFDFNALKKRSEKFHAIKKPAVGRFCCVERLRRAIRAAKNHSPLDVYEIAGKMSSLMDETITKDMIYSWTRESDEINGRPRRSIPSRCLPAFCEVTGDTTPIEILMELVGLVVVPAPDAIRREVENNRKMIRELNKQNSKMESLLYQLEHRNE